MTKILLVIACAALVAACSDVARRSPLAPTPVVAVATAPSPPPPPPPPLVYGEPYSELTIGTTILRTVDRDSNPECFPGFGCQYFRLTPTQDGELEVDLIWKPETQPSQTLDLSHRSAAGELWADYPSAVAATAHLTSHVKAGETSEITVWYTFPGVEFTLQTRLQPH